MTCLTDVCMKETELCNLRTIIRQSASERLLLEKTIAENNFQTVSVDLKLLRSMFTTRLAEFSLTATRTFNTQV